ncbi:hypothetical protein GW17_00043118 [Ensete ventricosum]|nr:hypothetical protein GW17_00043118 [Ensete ventricosum]
MGGTYRSVRSTYADRPLPSKIDRRRPIEGEIDRRRSISAVDSRLTEKSTVGSRLREKKRRRRRREKEEKKKRREEERIPISPCRPRPEKGQGDNTSPAPSLPAYRRRPRVARGRDRDRFFSRARRRSISPREETDRGDIRALLAYEVAALLLRCCDAAAVLPLRHFATVMLQWRCLFATAMLLLPFNAAVASQVSLHFSSFSFFFFFLLPLLFLHRTFLINLFFSLVQTPVRTDISYVGTSVWSGTT